MIDEEIHGEMTSSNLAGGKRNSKKMTPAEGAISWDTVADSGEVDHDDEEEGSPNQGVTNKTVFQRINLGEPLKSPRYDIVDLHVKKLPNGADLNVRRF